MNQNQFAESLMEIMLSWMRWLTGWFWNIVNSGGTSGGFLAWFSENWKSLTVFLIVVGLVVDWLIWMIRWRPYWLWLRKRQIIYEEVPVRKKQKPLPEADEFTEAFQAYEEKQSPAESVSRENTSVPTASPSSAFDDDDDVFSEWDSNDDPYAQSASSPVTDMPVSSEPVKKVNLNHSRPILGERMGLTDVDDGKQD